MEAAMQQHEALLRQQQQQHQQQQLSLSPPPPQQRQQEAAEEDDSDSGSSDWDTDSEGSESAEQREVDPTPCHTPTASGAAAAQGVPAAPGVDGAGISPPDVPHLHQQAQAQQHLKKGGEGKSRAGRKGKRGTKGKGAQGGLSKKTLYIVSNLEGHGGTHLTQQELEEMEDEKRQAEEERKAKEALRQKGEGQADMTIRILLLGDSGVGKTSLMLRYTEDLFSPNLLSTAGVDFKVRHMEVNGRRVRCQIWDTAGQEKFHVITRAYYRGAHGIALVYDVADADSFKNVNYWVANIQTHAPAAGREAICKVLLGNKVDLPAEHREVSTAAGREVGEEFGVHYFEVSAKDGTGVTTAFDTLAREIVEGLEAEAAAAAGAGGGGGAAAGGGARRPVRRDTGAKSSRLSRVGSEKCTVC